MALLALGDIDVGAEIGSGTFASVYKCRLKTVPGALYAVKSFHLASYGPDTSRRRRDAREASMATLRTELRLLRQLSKDGHPNVVRLIGSVLSEDNCMIVMELYDGSLDMDMEEKFEGCTWYTSPQILLLSRQLASGLRFLHSHEIAHRDLKPENVLVVYSSQEIHEVKLSDFGISVRSRGARETVCGTVSYMAPEVLQPPHQYIPAIADMYSLGIMLFELLFGARYEDRKHEYEENGTPVLDKKDSLVAAMEWDERDYMAALVDQYRLCCLSADKRPSASELCDAIGVLPRNRGNNDSNALDRAGSHSYEGGGDVINTGASRYELASTAKHIGNVTALSNAGDHHLLLGFANGTLEVWSWELLCALQSKEAAHNADVTAFQFCAERVKVVSSSEDGNIFIWDWVDGQLGSKLRVLYHNEGQPPVLSVVLTEDSIFSGAHDKDIVKHRWDGHGRDYLVSPRPPGAWIRQIRAEEKMERLVAACDDGALLIFDLSSNLLLSVCNADGNVHADYVRCVSLNSRGIVAGSDDETMTIWAWDGTLKSTIRSHNGWIFSIISNDHIIISGARDGKVMVHDWSGKLLATLSGHRKSVYGVIAHPATWDESGKRNLWAGALLSAGRDAHVCLWTTPQSLDKPALSMKTNDDATSG